MATLTEGLHLDVSHADYHADPCAEPSLSSSAAGIMLGRSPLHAWNRHPRLGGATDDEGTDATKRGSLIHTLLLGVGQEIEAVSADDWRTKAAREAREAAIAAGRLPVLARVLESTINAIEKIRARLRDVADNAIPGSPVHAVAGALDPDVPSEVTAIWRSPWSGGDVLCRGRLDKWRSESALIVDLKSCENARGAASGRSMVAYGLDVQWAAYTEAIAMLYPALAGRVSMAFAFVEVVEPYDVIIAEPDGSMQEFGQRKWRRAVEEWGRARAANKWPGYPREIQRIGVPPWMLVEDMNQQAAQMGNDNDTTEF